MTSDRYTRAILTLIAASVLWIAIQLTPPIKTASAARSPKSSAVDVNIVSIDGKAFGPVQVPLIAPALPVRVQ